MTMVVPAIPIRGGAFEGEVTRSLHTSDTLLQFWKYLLKRAFVLQEEARAHLSYLQEIGCWDFDANTI
jgi:hypothetical protein